MSNADVYCSSDADSYYDRNARHGVSHFVRYLQEIIHPEELIRMSLAEFGIGNGANLLYLSELTHDCCGFEASESAVKAFQAISTVHHNQDKLQVYKQNLAKPFDVNYRFDIIIFGFFPYYCDEADMKVVLQNTLKHLKPKGLIFVFDFLTRENRIKMDSRNPDLQVHKRNMSWWNQYFSEFNLLDFRLFDANHSMSYHTQVTATLCNLHIDHDDDNWQFAALYQLRQGIQS